MENLQKLYFTSDATAQDQTYSAGAIYDVSHETAQEFINQGIGEAVSFPGLEAIQNTINTRFEQYKNRVRKRRPMNVSAKMSRRDSTDYRS